MRRRILTGLLTASLAAGVGVVSAGPASAAVPAWPHGSGGALAADCSASSAPKPCTGRGPAVAAVQRALVKLRYDLGSYTSGVYGWSTARAVLKYKRDHSDEALGPSSRVGPRTYASITAVLSSGGSGGGSSFAQLRASAPYAYTSGSYARWYAQRRLPAYGWSASQMNCLRPMWIGESHWSYREVTGRYIGIPQTTVGVVNNYGYTEASYRANPEVQVEVGLKYIRDRYGSPCKAWDFWKAQGAWQDKNDPQQWWGGWY